MTIEAMLDTQRDVTRVGRLLERIGDRLNPILVKETRQSLKSRQFVLTFAVLLVVAWIWSFTGVAMIGPEVFYAASGLTMFNGYFLILVIPMLIVVPYGAFRSLAAEQEDRTYELLSITTLSPQQIIAGKLISAGVQMALFLSAISPCLAFTYLLRGVDIQSILFTLFYTTVVSLGLSGVCLLIGTLASERYSHAALSVVAILGCAFATFIWCTTVIQLLYMGGAYELDFQTNAAIMSAFVAGFVMVFYAAAARITFASENRSTRLRGIMLAQCVLFVAWMGWAWVGPAEFEEEIIESFVVGACLFWFAMGTLMVGESPHLSFRVRRKLPQSFFGRVLFTWFNPGPGTGYLFAITNIVVVFAIALIAAYATGLLGAKASHQVWSGDDIVTLLVIAVLAVGYAAFYLGVELLLVRMLRKTTKIGFLLPALVQIMLLLFGCIVPVVIAASSQMLTDDYTLLQISNPFWVIACVIDNQIASADLYIAMAVVSTAAVLVFLANLPSVVREVRYVRVVKPGRVAKEDAEILALRLPPKPEKNSPWDE